MDTAIQFDNVEKEFAGFKLGPLNFELEAGKVLGYIGPNGSGKTTTMQCVTGLLKPEKGNIRIFGEVNNPGKVNWKAKIGYVGDEHVFYETWSCAKNLKFISQFYPDWDEQKAVDLIKRFRLPIEQTVASLSKGNRIKLSLIQALSHNPRLLILDEPTEGLDPVVRSEFMDTLFEIIESEERAIFYSTHIISEIERICDELVFIDEGQLKLKIDKEQLLEEWRVLTFKCSDTDLKLKGIVDKRIAGEDCQVITQSYKDTIDVLRSLGVNDIREARMSMEDIAVRILKGGENVEAL